VISWISIMGFTFVIPNRIHVVVLFFIDLCS